MRARVHLGEEAVTLLKPLSYVNLSGPVVRKVAEDLEVETRDVIVVLDDFALPLGSLRIRVKGSGGGHNGLESVVRALRTEKVARLRIGIGEPRPGRAVDHVLSRFGKDEQEVVRETIGSAADAVALWVSEGIEAAMNRYNRSSPEET
jgi:PTH1 family peptidyl-tRNA hydrolase